MVKDMWKIVKWPIFYFIIQFVLIFILAFIYNIVGNDMNLFSNFLSTNQIYITISLGLIFIPILFKNYKKLNKKEELKIDFKLIFIGIILSLIYNVLSFYINKFFNISNLYQEINIFKTLISMVLIGPIIEELMFRGIIYNSLKEKYSNMKAILITTTLFSLMHVNIFQMIYAFALGFILIYVYEKYKTIKAPIIVHMFSNLTTTLFMNVLIQNNFIFNYLVLLISLILLFVMYKKEVFK